MAARGRRAGPGPGPGRGRGRRGGGGARGSARLALLAAVVAGSALGARAQDYDYGDYDDDYSGGGGFTPGPLPPTVASDPTQYTPTEDLPGNSPLQNPTPTDILNEAGTQIFNRLLGLGGRGSGPPRPIDQLISFLNRAIPIADEKKAGLEAAKSGLDTVSESLNILGGQYDEAANAARRGNIYKKKKKKQGEGQEEEQSDSTSGSGVVETAEERAELCARCVDTDPTGQCVFWAGAGQCSENTAYMLRSCGASCCAAGADPPCKARRARTREARGGPRSGGGGGGGMVGGAGSRVRRTRARRDAEQRQGRSQTPASSAPEEGEMPAAMVEELARLAEPSWFGEKALCLDLRSECAAWGRQGLCMRRPEYMAEFCPKACMLCP